MINDYDCIVWDYNGTIADDVALGIKCVNVLLERRGLPKIDTVARYHELFGFPIKDYYARAGFDFSVESYEVVAHEWVELYRDGESKVTLNEGILRLLSRIQNEGVPQVILSMSERSMLLDQIGVYGIEEYFDEILGLDDIYAYSKTDLAIEFARGRSSSRILMIGDTSHDYECATSAGFDIALVAKGHESYEDLISNFGKRCRVYRDFFELYNDLFGDKYDQT